MNKTSFIQQAKTTGFLPHAQGMLQRKCACGNQTVAGDECEACKKKRNSLQRKLAMGTTNDPLEQEADRVADQVMGAPAHSQANVAPPRIQRFSEQASKGSDTAPDSVDRVLASPGKPLDPALHLEMGQRFGYDFSKVRVHTGAVAEQSARDVNALAYTVGRDIVFGAGRLAPDTREGRRLIAHELTHVVQQSGPDGIQAGQSDDKREFSPNAQSPKYLARACTSAAVCSPTGVPGSATEFGAIESGVETGPRARRRSMTPARATSTGHAGRARQLEIFLNGQQPGRLANIHGVFIDADLSPGTGALTQNCADWANQSLPAGAPLPPQFAGATKDCTFVHGSLNREALAFNTTKNKTIGGLSREEWRIDTLQLLIHETEHPRFETATAGRAAPAGVSSATCTRANIEPELSEIAAVISEFPTISRSADTEADPAGPIHRSMDNWFQQVIFNGGENIQGALLQIGCSCECPEVDAFVSDTFTEVASSGGWTLAERNAFNTKVGTELAGPVRPIWPL